MDVSANKQSAAEPEVAAGSDAPLLICGAGLSDQAALATLLEQAAPQNAGLRLDQAAAAMAAQPESRLLLIFSPPQAQLAQAMMQRTAPGAALDDWIASATVLLEVLRRNRRRTTLVEGRVAQVYADVFTARLGLAQETAAALAALPRPRPDPVLLAMADACVLRSPRARVLSEELAASALDLSNGDPAPPQDLDAAFQHYAKTRSELAEIQCHLEQQYLADQARGAEMQQIADQLTRQDAALAERAAAVDGLENRLQAAGQHSAALQTELEQMRARLGSADTRNAALAAELERSRAELSGERDTIRDVLTALQQEAEQEQGRLTADLATLQDHAAGLESALAQSRSRLSSVIEEQGSLMVQLHRAQADLAGQSDEHRNIVADLEANRNAKKSLNLRVRQLAAEKAALEGKLAEVEDWIHGIMASRSYRIMEPLRRLRAIRRQKE